VVKVKSVGHGRGVADQKHQKLSDLSFDELGDKVMSSVRSC
jgi:hypothetical protein